MKTFHSNTLQINPEFESLQTMCSEEYLKELEEDIIKNGLSHSLLEWQGYLIDGHKRYKICKKNNIPFNVNTIPFNDKLTVLEWICNRNLQKDDLSEEYRKYYIGKIFWLKNKANIAYKKINSVGKHDDNNLNRADIAHQIGMDFNVSFGTILKYGIYSNSIDNIRLKEPEIAKAILLGKINVSHKNVVEISQLSSDDLHLIKNYCCEHDEHRLTYQEIWTELRWNRASSKSLVYKTKKNVIAPIKQMPKYDPDAELSRLTLTIPSWIKSIERTADTANFANASIIAKEKLKKQLKELSVTADILCDYMSEATDE